MSITNPGEYDLTRSKLADTREMIGRIEQQPPVSSTAAHAASLRSLQAFENQLVEELIRYEIAVGIRPITGRAPAASRP